jgi:hypothetical protein
MYECWVWLVKEEDGSEGPVAAFVPELPFGPLVLQHSRRPMAEAFGPIAHNHGHETGRPVRLAHLVEVPAS